MLVVKETVVNISTTITYQDGYSWNDIKPYVENVIDEYFLELSKEWENEKNLIVRISQIETRILNVAGVIDIYDTKINNATQNLILDEENIPVRGEIIG